MARHPLWNDEYWPLLLQVYQKKPMGVKPLYSKGMVNLSMELHIPPVFLHEQMFKLRLVTPQMNRLWQRYGNSPKKLARDCEKIRKMQGYGNAADFYAGVGVNTTFEDDWQPLKEEPTLTLVKLTIILDLYFQLTPITMVAETPEIVDLAKLLKISPALIVEVMDVYQFCDPYLERGDILINPLLKSCETIWQRYGNDNPEKLYVLASQLKEFFR